MGDTDRDRMVEIALGGQGEYLGYHHVISGVVDRLIAAGYTAPERDARPTGGPLRPSKHDALGELVRQRTDEGWTVQHDRQHAKGQLLDAALCYLTGDPEFWPWANGSRFGSRDYIKAAGLIAAERQRAHLARRAAEHRLRAVEASRRDWAAEADAVQQVWERQGETRRDLWQVELTGDVPCFCLTAALVTTIATPGFSVPVCAVHPLEEIEHG